ncbi:MAG: DoxX family protein [Sphingobacteriaceae bacterium]|nr:MAG: DoxX family protein [Sphingobacteriaceae bacterium]
MSTKTRNIIGWVLTAVLAFVFFGSASMKIMGGAGAAKGAAGFGLTPEILRMIGVVEILSIVLFIIPRTGLLGTLLLAAYLGGAVATHLEHGQPVFAPVILQCIVWITATIRFPELSQRLLGKAVTLQNTLT